MAMTRPLLRADLIEAFGEDPGSLPDGVVVGSTPADWVRVFELIDHVGWDVAWNNDGRRVKFSDLDDPKRARELFALRPRPGIQINFFPGDNEIDFDIDLREYADQETVDALCAVIAQLGSVLDKSVVLTHEGGSSDDVVVRYDPTTDEFLVPRTG